MESRSRLRFRIFALLFFAVLGAAAWYLLRRSAPDEPGAAVPGGTRPPAESAAAAAPPSEGPVPGSGLAIEGSPRFSRQVTRSLKLIWLYDRDAFNFVRKYVYVVRSADKTSFGFHEGVATVFLSDANAYRSDAWCAGIIAHHAWHSYHRSASLPPGRRRKTPPPPGGTAEWIEKKTANPLQFDVTTLRDVTAQEAKADEFQLRVLAAVGASRAEINRVRRRDPRDLSVSHDGNYPSRP
ncbi:MAG TPA: hypothetical protein PKK31_00525 [Elusimicrobiales bacterium]|nr:hypothetical protein [Elusimicrobiales bacterium]